jgi:hypothetical protein
MAGEQGHQPGRDPDRQRGPAEGPREETEPAQEWGERIGTGKAIVRGGKKGGPAEGAEEQQP